MNFKALFGSFAAVILVSFTTVYAQTPSSCEISGHLYYPNGTPAANAQLTIVKVAQNGGWIATSPQTVTTDASGFVDFSVLRNSVAYVQGNGITGLNLLGGVPLQVPDAPSASVEALWQLGVTSVNGRQNDVNLAASDVTNALGYAPVDSAAIIAAINTSPEAAKIGDSLLSSNVPRLNQTNTFTSGASMPSLVGGAAPSSTLNLAGTSNSSPSGANIILNSAGQGNVLIGSATDKNARLAIVGANTAGTTGLSLTKGSGASSALDIVMDNTGKAVRFFTPGWPEAHSYFNTRGAFYTRAWMVISGRGSGSGDQWNIQHPSADPFMLGVWSDIFGPAIQVRSQQKKFGAYLFSGMDYAGNYTMSIEEDGELRWGATTRAGQDTNLFRAAPGTLRTNSSLIIDKPVAIGTNAIPNDAILDLNGGDTKGLRLEPRSALGAPKTGSWSIGTIILDSTGVPYICVASGAPGTWRRTLSDDPSATNTTVSSFNGRNGAVTLGANDVSGALGYTPANPANTVLSLNGRTGATTVTNSDVSSALGYAPVSPTSVLAAINSSPENGFIRLSTAGGPVLKFTPPDPGIGSFNMSVDGGTNASNPHRDWTTTWGYNQGQDGSVSELQGEPALSHRLESFWVTPDGTEAMEAHLQYVSATGAISRPYAYFINRKTDNIQEGHEVDALGISDRATKVQYVKFQSNLMLLYGGTTIRSLKNNVPFLQQNNAANTASVSLMYLDSTDRVNIGAATNAVRLSGSKATITTGNIDRVTVDSSGNVGIANTAPTADAVLDVNGGNSKGLRIRPRTQAGAPTDGTWNVGTMIVDSQGSLLICTKSGSPGSWTTVGKQQ